MIRHGYQWPLHSSGERGGMTKREIRQMKKAVLALAAVLAVALTASALVTTSRRVRAQIVVDGR